MCRNPRQSHGEAVKVKRKRYEQLERIANSRLQWTWYNCETILDATFEELYLISKFAGNSPEYEHEQYFSGPTSLKVTINDQT